jgi:uncharacterized membrane protein YhaH (DUF805 family)
MTDYFNVLAKYATFSGRARRREYWIFVLGNFLAGMILGVIAVATESSVDTLTNIYSAATLLPSIAVGVRRMHDTGRSGWCILIPFYNLILLLSEGTQGENRFGPDPKAVPVFA